MERIIHDNQCDQCKAIDDNGINNKWYSGKKGNFSVSQEQIGSQIKTTSTTEFHSFIAFSTFLCHACYAKALNKSRKMNTVTYALNLLFFIFVFIVPVFILHKPMLEMKDIIIAIWAILSLISLGVLVMGFMSIFNYWEDPKGEFCRNEIMENYAKEKVKELGRDNINEYELFTQSKYEKLKKI